jgi:hypothetical protein
MLIDEQFREWVTYLYIDAKNPDNGQSLRDL